MGNKQCNDEQKLPFALWFLIETSQFLQRLSISLVGLMIPFQSDLL